MERKKPLTLEITRVVVLDRPITSKNSPINRIHALFKKTGKQSVSTSFFLPCSPSKPNVSVFSSRGRLSTNSESESKKCDTTPRNKAKPGIRVKLATPVKKVNNFVPRVNGCVGPIVKKKCGPKSEREKIRALFEKVTNGLVKKENEAMEMIEKKKTKLETLEVKVMKLGEVIQMFRIKTHL